MITIMEGDNLGHLRAMEPETFHSCVTDPPYGLRFMNRKWDSGVPSVEQWREVWRVLKPGAHVVAFFGTRTYHRGVCALEDAGFEIRDMLGWLYGSGFPKSLNIGKATGMEAWEGWGTALKPGIEPIVLARKPLQGTVAQNVGRHGCGGLNIDACRVEEPEGVAQFEKRSGKAVVAYGDGLHGSRQLPHFDALTGRFPATDKFQQWQRSHGGCSPETKQEDAHDGRG